MSTPLQPLAAPAIVAPAHMILGYVPLTDAAPLLVARDRGLFRAHGLAVALAAMPAWASLRDRLAFGALDGGHMLAPMALSTTLGIGGVQAEVTVGATLSRNGNRVVFGHRLLRELGDGAALGPGLLRAAVARRNAGAAPPVLAVVFPFSSHNYLLRHWLAGAGIDPDRDVRLVVVPPPDVPDALADGRIDGFCAGEPWGSRAIDLELGEAVLATSDVWPDHPEKVLAFRADAVAADRAKHVAAVAAVIEASRWIADPANTAELVHILRVEALPGVPSQVLEVALTPAGGLRPMFQGAAATRPHAANGAWWLEQMRAWRHVPSATPRDTPDRVWQPALWHEAAALVGTSFDHDSDFPEPPPSRPEIPAADGVAMHIA